ncbi:MULTISPECIES: protein DpdF [Cyanophyceae]|uniref:protein DpdF n=1 Tax=Cyanophyceae TaxID=3028117 RepID=UPI0016887524|nr:protein DpdF [Trichocoleus sp. FACHB-69]MBD1932585.1 ATP-dependent DNA helicase RecQ [Trichocoleus sp. FACHB-69]
MTDSFEELREIIQTGGSLPADLSHFSEACHRRLLDALGVGSPYAPAAGDIACLVRHVLRREDEDLKGGMSQSIKVPRTPPYPLEREIWQRCGIKVLREEPDYFLISAQAWKPEWLDFSDQYPPDKPAFDETPRRNYDPVPGDPFLDLLGLKDYQSVGQREAIRAVLTAPQGSTLTINLPTGSGKSLCAQLPALLKSRTSGVSVVVVPTTALAIDQERALEPFINHPTAYYGDDSEEGKERREGIRQRIRQGTQRIIFTSPESLIDSLAPSVYEAAKLGMLRYFVIDEAHMVEQWGDEFRPAFQELPGLRRALLRLTSFNTLLLTATLTESCLDTLETLFSQPGSFQVISAVQLRPEPSYWFSWCRSEQERRERLLEAVYHLPRPLIIYATEREDVFDWSGELSRVGFKRYAMMTGESTAQERSQLIKNWHERRVDIVVATSAFGLGVDQADVRAVIHACVPETIDRFYQEVGRGGRDGKAAVSLTLYTSNDQKVAKSLKKSTITIDRGFERWQSMFYRKEIAPDRKFRVPINAPPSMKEGDIDMYNKKSRKWNIHTLTLMSRAGLIEVNWEDPPIKTNFDSEESYLKAFEHYQNHRIINIINEYHLSKDSWETQIDPIRLQRQDLSYQKLQLMKEALWTKPQRCLSEIFAEAYTISVSEKLSPRKPIIVARACGGCAFCRKRGVKPFPGIMPAPLPVWQHPDFFVGGELQRLLAEEKLLLIFYESVEAKKWERQRNKLLRWLIAQGIHNVVTPQELHSIFKKEANRVTDAFIFFFEDEKYQPIKMPRLPTLIVHSQKFPLPQIYLKNSTSQAPHIILLPVSTPDPSRDDRRLIDIFPGRSFRFEPFCTEIGI